MTISGIVKRVSEETGYDREQTLALALSEVESDPKLLLQAARERISEAISDVFRHQRASFFVPQSTSPGPTVVNGDDRQRMAKALNKDWYSMILLPSGLRLGDAYEADVKRAIAVWGANARSNALREEFGKVILKGMKPGKTVRESWTPKKLAPICSTFVERIQEAA